MGRPLGSKNKKPYPVEARHKSYWANAVFGLDKELQAFKGCHNRVKCGKSPEIAWTRTLEGFAEFIKEIGPLPPGVLMKKPSVGRKDHAKGYVPGNIEWQEFNLNSKLRRGTRYESDAYPMGR